VLSTNTVGRSCPFHCTTDDWAKLEGRSTVTLNRTPPETVDDGVSETGRTAPGVCRQQPRSAGRFRRMILPAPRPPKVTVTNPPPGGGVSTALNFIVDNKGGARGTLTNIDTRSCPVIYGTLYASDLLGSPITSLGAANLRCTEDGTQVNCNAIRAESRYGTVDHQ